MVSERYWDIAGCCWKPCHPSDSGTTRSSSIAADMAVLGSTAPAALPTSTGPDAMSADSAPAEVTGPVEG
jgi:hypothetical protein